MEERLTLAEFYGLVLRIDRKGEPINQCDGCRHGLPKDANGIHRDPFNFTGDHFCTKDRYIERP